MSMTNLIRRSMIEIMRDEMVRRSEIAAFIADGPRTIPEVARHLEQPAYEVMIWVMAMWKYGVVRETGEHDENGYHRYELNE